jgi:hypothetical protein
LAGCPRPGGEGRKKEKEDLEADDLHVEDLETAAEEARKRQRHNHRLVRSTVLGNQLSTTAFEKLIASNMSNSLCFKKRRLARQISKKRIIIIRNNCHLKTKLKKYKT